MTNKIVLVPFPFDDLTGAKLRPALCLTNPIGTYQYVVVCFITSQLAKAGELSDLSILTTDPDFALTGLKVDSAIRFHRLVTILTQLIQRQLGVFPETHQDRLKHILRQLFGL